MDSLLLCQSTCSATVYKTGNKPEPVVSVLDDNYVYGCEFLGAQPVMALTPLTDRCVLAVTQTLAQHKATLLCGASSSGRTESIKVLQ